MTNSTLQKTSAGCLFVESTGKEDEKERKKCGCSRDKEDLCTHLSSFVTTSLALSTKRSDPSVFDVSIILLYHPSDYRTVVSAP